MTQRKKNIKQSLERRTFLQWTAAGMSSLAFPLLWSGCQKNKTKKQPNVLFIVVDDLNSWVGCLRGHPDAKTPNIDRLANKGILFEHAYCSSPLCNPARSSLLTGLRPSTTGIYGNQHPLRMALPDAVTIPQHFRDHGYQTLSCGKIFHHEDLQSWNVTFSPEHKDPVPEKLPANGIPNARFFDWAPLDVGDDKMRDSTIADWVVRVISVSHDQPFFLAWGIQANHLPYYAPRKYFYMHEPAEKIHLPEILENDLNDVPSIGRAFADQYGQFWWSVPGGDHNAVLKYRQWQEAVLGYLATVSFTDALIGRVLDALEKGPNFENTVIILLSDQGTHLGEKCHWRKHDLWEESLRVPLIISTPELQRQPGRCLRTVSLLDIYPTLIDLCRLTSKKELEGQSLLPLLKNPKIPWNRPVLSTYGCNNHSIRSERWHYIRYEDGTEELYDHKNDPHEWTNLAAKSDYKNIIIELEGWLPGINSPDAPSKETDIKLRSRSKWEKLG